MVTTLQHKTTHTIKIEYSDEPVTSFGGLVLAERMAERLGLWRSIEDHFPERNGEYGWMEVVKSVTLGLLSGAQGTFAAQSVREDAALLRMLDLEGAPEEATVWRSLKDLGTFQADGILPKVQALMARRTLDKMTRSDLLVEGFIPVFGDGTLLEGSARREGSKYIKEKGRGLMWSAIFVGRVLAAQRLAPEGGGEHSDVRAMLREVQKNVLKPLRMMRQALVLLDSLHGDDTQLSQLEEDGVHYVVGANKLDLTERVLSERVEFEWESLGARPSLGWTESAVCACWIQCKDWETKRLLVGRRWKREGEMIWNYAGVMTDLREKDLVKMMERGESFAQSVWRLYDAKAGMETLFSDGLSDLGLHHPPCQEHKRNAGFYALAALAWALGTAVDAIGGQDSGRGSMTRKDGNPRKRATSSRMRFWRLRRELFTLPGRIARHGREMVVRLLGLGESAQARFDRYWTHVCRC
jgi:hypothetical protein